MKIKMVRNAGQSQRFRFVVLVIGCFLVSMTFIVISRPSALSAFITSSSVPDQTTVVAKNSDARETVNSSGYSKPSELESETIQPSENKYDKPLQEEKPLLDDDKPSFENLPETEPEKSEGEKLAEVQQFEDEQPNRLTLPTVSNYTINDPDPSQTETSTTQEQPDSDPAPWNPERKPLCDTSGGRADVCDMNGEIRIPGNSSTVIFYEAGNSQESYTIHPYARKGDNWCFTKVREITVKSSNTAPKCTVTHNVPAIMFSIGGYTGNQFHDFTDILIPLFLTAAPFNGEVKLIMTDFSPYWIYKYLPFLQKISKYPVIEYEKDQEVHCFKHVIVGLHSNKELSIDPQTAPNGYSMLDFTKFLRSAFSLPRETITNIEDLHVKSPKMLLINRKRSRTITNIDEISKIANDLGFEVIINDDADIGSDVGKYAEIVNSCDVLIGVHGAGLTNAVFLPPNATMIQIVPWGNLENIAMYDFGNPATDMNLNYVQYSITIDESSLSKKYPRDHPVFTDPQQYHNKDFNTMKATFLDDQDVKLDVKKFRSVIWNALEHVIQ